MVFPFRDGRGILPDSWREALGYLIVIVFLGSVLVFTGVDAQIEYAVRHPGQYFGVTGLSAADSSDSEINKVLLEGSELTGLEFSTSNRVGMDSIATELAFCGGIGSDGSVYQLRVADDFSKTTEGSVTFSCGVPRSLTIHTHPDGGSLLSEEDKRFSDDFRPRATCIVHGEPTVSPVSKRVGGVSCFKVSSGFPEIPVYLTG